MKPSARRQLIAGAPTGALIIPYDQIRREMRVMATLAAGHLTVDSVRALTDLEDHLRHHAASAGVEKIAWSTNDVGEITTNPNLGAHQPGRIGHGLNLRGRIGFKWEIKNWGSEEEQVNSVQVPAP